jgi:hypothetical protein
MNLWLCWRLTLQTARRTEVKAGRSISNASHDAGPTAHRSLGTGLLRPLRTGKPRPTFAPMARTS